MTRSRRAIAELLRNASAGGGAFLYERLLAQDELLVSAGFPRLSDWWRDTFREFLCGGTWRWLVLRVGRRGGKSSSLCRLAVVIILWGRQTIPPGDVGYWAFVSVTREEAEARLFMIKAILDAIGVGYEPVEHGIRVEGLNKGFKVLPATIGGVSGFTCVGFVCDEMTKWKDKDSGANPSKQVVASLKPTIAGVEDAIGVFASSAFSTIDLHYDMVEQGTTADQMVAKAPTWVARPSLTREMTRELEDDEETWLREYGNEPMGAGERDFFDPVVIERAVDASLIMPLARIVGHKRMAGGDFAFERNASALAVVDSTGEREHQKWTLAELVELKPEPGMPLMPSAVIERFASVLQWHGVPHLIADQHYRMSVVELLMAHHLLFFDAPAGQTGKAEMFTRARVLLKEGRLAIPGQPEDVSKRLVKQLKQVRGKPTAGGGISITQQLDPSGRHGDLVSAVVAAVWQRQGKATDASVTPPEPGSPDAINAEAAAYKRKVMLEQERANLRNARRLLAYR